MAGSWRTRWAAIGAAVAVSLGAGGIGISHAAIGSGQRAVFVAIAPCRLVDTRGAVGPRTAPLGPGEVFGLQVTGSTGECVNIPADAAAAALNVTAIRPTASSFLTVYPADAASVPLASNLNWAAGDPPTPNKVDVRLGTGGAVKLFNSVGNVHVAVDLVGYYIDHNHDDRYYTKSQIDGITADMYTKSQTDAIAARAEAITGIGQGIPANLVVGVPFFTESITTNVAGQLMVSRSGRAYVNCAGGAIYYNVVDGVPIRSSASYSPDSTPLTATLVGTTTDIVPAGNHTISLGGQCYSGAANSGSGYTGFSSLSVVVIP
jgi:hypothetical protein